MIGLETAIMCLALNVYHEARGEAMVGQYAVALVTWNRAERQPEQVCPVVLKRKQFSWTINRVRLVKAGYQLKPNGVPRDERAWEKAVKVAKYVINGKMYDFTEGATHYHTIDVNPHWAPSLERITQIGRHYFYR